MFFPEVKSPIVVLLSGGIDSAVTLALARREGLDVVAVSFDYGQRHALEITKSSLLADRFETLEHLVLSIDTRAFHGTSLVVHDEESAERPADENGVRSQATVYVPARNTLFLAHALAVAESRGARAIVIGSNADDYEDFPDCRPEYLRAFEATANLGTRVGGMQERPIKIVSPLTHLSKKEVVKLMVGLDIEPAMTWSCYTPTSGGLACGTCAACRLRIDAFAACGVEDAIYYVD